MIGKAIDYLPYFIYTFDELGKIGIGKDRGKYELKTIKSLELGVKSETKEKIIYSSDTKTLKPFETSNLNLVSTDDSPRRESEILNSVPNILNVESSILNLNFLTPTRIVYDSHLTLDLEFHILIRQLLRRLSLLSYFHCGYDMSGWDFKGIIEMAKKVAIKKQNLRWHDWERYSFRQDAKMKMGGFVGEITFEGNIEPFMPLIKAGEILHVGKGTSFGLGKYEVSEAVDLNDLIAYYS